MAPRDPDRAEAIATRVTSTARDGVLADIATALAEQYPGRAERVAAVITDEAERGRALGGVAAALALRDPSRAENTADRITDAAAKTRALVKVATRWLTATLTRP